MEMVLYGQGVLFWKEASEAQLKVINYIILKKVYFFLYAKKQQFIYHNSKVKKNQIGVLFF